MLRKRDVFVGVALGTVAGLIVAPIIELVIQSMVGESYPLAVFAGALLATTFFAVSAVIAALYKDSPNLKTAMLLTYVMKTSLLFAVLQGLRLSSGTGKVFGISIAISAVAYLAFQTAYIAKWRRRKWQKLSTKPAKSLSPPCR